MPNLHLQGGSLIQNRIFLERGYFEQSHLKKIKTYVKQEGTVLDIGANIGNHTLYFVNECNVKKVYAFEPVKSTFAILEKNISINNLVNTVSTYNIALGKEQSKGHIIYVGDAGGNKVAVDETGDILIISLDDLEIPEHIDFVKIDVEGYEYNVLLGAKQTLRQNHPVIMIEIFEASYNKVNLLLNSLGYDCELRLERDYIYKYKIK